MALADRVLTLIWKGEGDEKISNDWFDGIVGFFL
jgi:hypothetical protein